MNVWRFALGLAFGWLLGGVRGADAKVPWQELTAWGIAIVCVTAVLIVTLIYEDDE